VLNSVEKTEEIMETHLDRERLFPTSNSNCYRSEIVGRVYCGSELNNWVTEKVLISAKNSYTDLSEKLEIIMEKLSMLEMQKELGNLSEVEYQKKLKAQLAQLHCAMI
jgi:hypothetical protein